MSLVCSIRRDMLSSLSDNNGYIFGFDFFPEFVVPNVQALQNALSDPNYKQHVQPDEAIFIDVQNSR